MSTSQNEWLEYEDWYNIFDNKVCIVDYKIKDHLYPILIDAEKEGNLDKAYLLKLLICICSSKCNTKSSDVNFNPPFETFLPHIDSITTQDLDLLANFLDKSINKQFFYNPEIQAKVADVLRHRNYGDVSKYTEIAVENYLDSEQKLQDVVEEETLFSKQKIKPYVLDAEEKLLRALQIAKQSGTASTIYKDVIDHIKNSIFNKSSSLILGDLDTFNYSLKNIDLLLSESQIDTSNVLDFIRLANQNIKDLNVLLTLNENEVEFLISELNKKGSLVTPKDRQELSEKTVYRNNLFFQLIEWNKLCARLNIINNNPIIAEQLFNKVIDLHEQMAKDGLKYRYINFATATSYIYSALKFIGLNKRDRIKDRPVELRSLDIDLDSKFKHLHKIYLGYQKKAFKDSSPKEFEDLRKSIESEFKVSDSKIYEAEDLGISIAKGQTIDKAINNLLDLNFTPALDSLFHELTPNHVMFSIRVTDIENKTKYSQALSGEIWQDAMGYILIPRPIQQQDKENALKFFKEKMKGTLYLAANGRSRLNSISIDSAIKTVSQENPGQYLEIPNALLQSPFIQPNQQNIVKRALDAGLNGDWFTASHILAAQFERSIRQVLTSAGYIPTNGNIQENFRLEQVLNRPGSLSYLENLFGEETIFALKMVLLEKTGHNFRNRIQHGLLTGDELSDTSYSAPARYMWWLFLKMCNQFTSNNGVTNPLNISSSLNWSDNLNTLDSSTLLTAENLVKGKNIHEALKAISNAFDSPPKKNLEMAATITPLSVTEIKKDMRAMVRPHYSDVGNTVRASLKIISDQEAGNPNLFNAIKYYVENSLLVKNTVYQTNNIDDRSEYWAKAIFAGLHGDGILALNALLPQIEDSIRNILQKNDLITSFLTEDEKQDDYPLHVLIQEYRDELNAILGEDTVFDLEGLLVDGKSGGPNLRNLNAHGLMEESDYYTNEAVYTWWLALKILSKFKN